MASPRMFALKRKTFFAVRTEEALVGYDGLVITLLETGEPRLTDLD